MPQVQRYGERKVSTDALPGVRKTASESAISEGAGVAAAQADRAGAMAGFGGQVARIGISEYGRIQQEERQRADEVALLNAESTLAKWENKRLYDPTQGALAVKGQESFGLPEQVGGEYEQVAGDIEKNLSTDRQRQLFARARAQRGISIDATLRRHVFGEMQNYEAKELQGFLENTQSLAIAKVQTPEEASIELGKGVEAIRVHAKHLGMGPEQVQKQVEDFESATHVGIIHRLLASDKDGQAKIYFEAAREAGQISGQAIPGLEKALEEGTYRGQSQKQADAIIAAGGTLTEQREKVRGIDDPKLRDAVEQRVEHEAVVKERADRETTEATLNGAYNIVDRTHDVTSIPPDVWTNLPGSAKSSLRNYAEHLARGVPVATDLPTYYALYSQASEDPETFLKQNLLNYKDKLDEGEFKQMVGLQASIRAGDRKKADTDLAGFRTHSQVLDDTLSQYGIDSKAKPGTADDKAIAQLRRMLDQRVEQFQQSTGKKAGNDDVQQMLDGLLSTSVKTPGSWWQFWSSGSEKRLVDVTAGDIPATDRTQIEDALRRAGRPVSDATVLDVYLEHKARTKK